MIHYVWKILEISAENEIITHAKYNVTANDEDHTVESEGNYFFWALAEALRYPSRSFPVDGWQMTLDKLNHLYK